MEYEVGGKDVYDFGTDTDTEIVCNNFDSDDKKHRENNLGNEVDVTRPPMTTQLKAVMWAPLSSFSALASYKST